MDHAHPFRAPDAPGASDPGSFSIVLGGPLYQLLRRAHVAGDALELARRRVAVIALLAWLPLLVLALAGGHALGGDAAVPFLEDAQVQVRFLVALPLLVMAELLVHQRLRPVAREFVARGLVPAESLERFRDCLRSAFRLRNSITAELAIVALIYGVGVPFVWRHFTALDVATWYATPAAEGARLTPAGFWYAYVSVPLFQFLLLRWYFRIAIWMRFLWQVSRIRLNLSAMHPDRTAGLGFLAHTVFAFVPLLLAHGALLAGTIANRIFYQGATLMDSRIEIGVMLAFMLLLVFAPLTVFAPQIAAAKRRAAHEYAQLAQRYVRDFEAKWIATDARAQASPLGESDIQSLADLNNSFATIHETRAVPVTRDTLLMVALATLAPLAPLLLTVIPAEELAKHLLKLLL